MAFDMRQALQSPGMAMASGAMRNLGNPYGPQVDPMQAYQQTVMRNAALAQQQKAQQRAEQMMRMREQQEARQQAAHERTMAVPLSRTIAPGQTTQTFDPETQEWKDEPGGGGFAGTSLDAQLLNIVRNPEAHSPEDVAYARAQLQAPRTIMTPQGQMTIPGKDISMYGGAAPVDAGGTNADVYGQIDKPLTEGQAKNRGFFNRAVPVHSDLLDLESKGVRISPEMINAYLNYQDHPLGAVALRNLLSSDQRRYLELLTDSGMIQLRDESGAALGTEEIARQMKQLIAATNDTEDQLRDRQRRRELAIENYFVGGGRWNDEDRAIYEDVKSGWGKIGTPSIDAEVETSKEYDPNDANTW